MRQDKATVDRQRQDELYREASCLHGAVITRLARGYEADPDKQRDLFQEIHLELWISLKLFDGRCSLRTWVYRIAHNVAASHVVRSSRLTPRLVDLETLEGEIPIADVRTQPDHRLSAAILLDLIRRLKPVDRQIILLYLEGEAAEAIADVTGLSAVNVATKTHRIKRLLRQKYLEGADHART